MKQFIKSLIFGGALIAASASQAAIVSINVFDDAPAAEALFLSTLGTYTTEEFESLAIVNGPQANSNQQLAWIDTAESFTTSVGTFTLVTPGLTDPADNERSGELKIESLATGEHGREVARGQWLDSNDARKVTWDISIGGGAFNALGFYLLDANDQGAKLTITLSNGLEQTFALDTNLPNSNQKYITIVSDVSVTSAVLTFNNSGSGRDGFGIDNVTVGTVPEPGTLLLMGLGLLGLGAARRRAAA